MRSGGERRKKRGWVSEVEDGGGVDSSNLMHRVIRFSFCSSFRV